MGYGRLIAGCSLAGATWGTVSAAVIGAPPKWPAAVGTILGAAGGVALSLIIGGAKAIGGSR